MEEEWEADLFAAFEGGDSDVEPDVEAALYAQIHHELLPRPAPAEPKATPPPATLPAPPPPKDQSTPAHGKRRKKRRRASSSDASVLSLEEASSTAPLVLNLSTPSPASALPFVRDWEEWGGRSSGAVPETVSTRPLPFGAGGRGWEICAEDEPEAFEWRKRLAGRAQRGRRGRGPGPPPLRVALKLDEEQARASERGSRGRSSRGRYFAAAAHPSSLRCTFCGALGHRVAGCEAAKAKRLFELSPHRSSDHLSRNLFSESQAKERLVCQLCGEGGGHKTAKCPRRLCGVCLQEGHVREKCPKPPAANRAKLCQRCQRRGHLHPDCPDEWRQWGGTVGAGTGPLVEEPLFLRPRHRSCFNCGRSGHLGHACRGQRPDQRLWPHTPTVAVYDSSGPVAGPSPRTPQPTTRVLQKTPEGPRSNGTVSEATPTCGETKKLRGRQLKRRAAAIQRQAEQEALRDVRNGAGASPLPPEDLPRPPTPQELLSDAPEAPAQRPVQALSPFEVLKQSRKKVAKKEGKKKRRRRESEESVVVLGSPSPPAPELITLDEAEEAGPSRHTPIGTFLPTSSTPGSHSLVGTFLNVVDPPPEALSPFELFKRSRMKDDESPLKKRKKGGRKRRPKAAASPDVQEGRAEPEEVSPEGGPELLNGDASLEHQAVQVEPPPHSPPSPPPLRELVFFGRRATSPIATPSASFPSKKKPKKRKAHQPQPPE